MFIIPQVTLRCFKYSHYQTYLHAILAYTFDLFVSFVCESLK
jgi:hypothetical protein